MLCDLAHEWVVPLPLIDGHGNLGSGIYPAAPPDVTESRLSIFGQLALSSMSGDVGPLPVGLINGDLYKGGQRLALAPVRVCRALLAIYKNSDLLDADIYELLGAPYFWKSPEIDGDVGAGLKGSPTTLTLRATFVIEQGDEGMTIVVRKFPDAAAAEGFAEDISEMANDEYWLSEHNDSKPSPVESVEDRSSGSLPYGSQEVRIQLNAGANPDQAIELLAQRDSSFLKIEVDMGRPVADTLRSWVEAHSDEGRSAAMQLAELLVADYPARPQEGVRVRSALLHLGDGEHVVNSMLQRNATKSVHVYAD